MILLLMRASSKPVNRPEDSGCSVEVLPKVVNR